MCGENNSGRTILYFKHLPESPIIRYITIIEEFMMSIYRFLKNRVYFLKIIQK